jgi:hypothetical protein
MKSMKSMKIQKTLLHDSVEVAQVTEEETLYTAEELQEQFPRAFGRAFDQWLRNATDYGWWESEYDYFEEVGKTLGFEFSHRPACNMNGEAIRGEVELFFSLDRDRDLTFGGSYTYRPGSLAAIKKNFPDKDLVRLAADLQELQRKNRYGMRMSLSSYHRYGYGQRVLVYDANGREASGDLEEAAVELVKGFRYWMLRRLEETCEHLTSVETFLEECGANGHLFLETGEEFYL